MRFPSCLGVFVVILCAGCATHAPRRALPPPPAASTVAIQVAVASARTHTQSASSRVTAVVKTVEQIIAKTDASTAAELGEVRAELLRVNVDLRDAQQDLAAAEVARASAQKAADKLQQWGVAQQQTAEANAEGWRSAEARALKAEGALRRLKLNLALLAGLAVGAVLWRLPFFAVLGPWALAVPFVGGILAAIATYFFV